MKKVLSMLILSGILCVLPGCGNTPSIPTKCDYNELYCAEGYESEYLYDCNYYYTDEESSGQIGDLYVSANDYVNFQFQNGVITNSRKLERSPYTTFRARRETDAQKQLLTNLCDDGSVPYEVLALSDDSRFYWNYRDYTIIFCNRYAANEAPIIIRYDSGTGDHAMTCTLSDSKEPQSIEMKRYGDYLCFDKDHTIELSAMTLTTSFEAPALPEYEQSDILDILESAESEDLETLMDAVRSEETVWCGIAGGIADGIVIYFEIDGTTYLLECDEMRILQKVSSFSVGDWTLLDINLYNDGYDWFLEME